MTVKDFTEGELRAATGSRDAGPHWSDCLLDERTCRSRPSRLIGVFEGEGIGPEVTACALLALSALSDVSGEKFEIVTGPEIGREAERKTGRALSGQASGFCREIFANGGAILSGPGGGRYVYELRREFNLFCKLSPIKPWEALSGAGRLKPEVTRGVDVLMVRENSSGIYHGKWSTDGSSNGRRAYHEFSYAEEDIIRVLTASARLALARRGRMAVVIKEAGVPAISALWGDCAKEVARRHGLRCLLMDIDNATYRLIQHPSEFDVIVAPNMLGDILSDAGGVLLGSRGLCFAGSFAGNGDAVYSTNHGAAYDLAGTDRANPAAHILALAMLLRESLHLGHLAARLEEAMISLWREGRRTEDIMEPGCRVTGTREMGELIAAEILSRKDGGSHSALIRGIERPDDATA